MDSLSVDSNSIITTSQVIAALVGIITASLIAVISSFITYKLTRKTRLEAEWRIDKLNQYRMYVTALSKIVNWRTDDEFNTAKRDYAHATNTLSLVAPKDVLDAAESVLVALDRLKIDKTEDADKFAKEALRKLIFEFRKDLNITPKDNELDFKFVLQSGR